MTSTEKNNDALFSQMRLFNHSRAHLETQLHNNTARDNSVPESHHLHLKQRPGCLPLCGGVATFTCSARLGADEGRKHKGDHSHTIRWRRQALPPSEVDDDAPARSPPWCGDSWVRTTFSGLWKGSPDPLQSLFLSFTGKNRSHGLPNASTPAPRTPPLSTAQVHRSEPLDAGHRMRRQTRLLEGEGWMETGCGI